MNNYQERPELAKKLIPISYVLSAVVILLIGVMGRIKIDLGVDFSALPAFHSFMNALTFFILLLALYFVKNKNIEAHKKTMFAAMIASSIFLVTYVLYHITTEPTSFCKEGAIKTFYIILLISHVILAAVIFPFILVSFIRGISYQIEKHKKLVRWVYPIWLYVTITGPILYLMLRPCRL